MGTSTLFRRWNDLRGRLQEMSKEDLRTIDEMSPWKQEKDKKRVGGWEVLMELHNGNFHPLLWWYGRLIRLEDAPRELAEKHYSKWEGKTLRASSWTLLRKFLENELQRLDRDYKRMKAREYRNRKARNR